mmetsp:Transcript_16664/g.42970  ORF Transcript_16664/g.42970 Transcript_16664/m.42970 type:complete len:143 (+) Transcript_16664:146-574(+)
MRLSPSPGTTAPLHNPHLHFYPAMVTSDPTTAEACHDDEIVHQMNLWRTWDAILFSIVARMTGVASAVPATFSMQLAPLPWLGPLGSFNEAASRLVIAGISKTTTHLYASVQWAENTLKPALQLRGTLALAAFSERAKDVAE